MEVNLVSILLVLMAGWAGGVLARRLGYPTVLGEILAGIALGPPILGLLQPDIGVSFLGELGVILMMLYIGLELEVSDLKRASWGGFLAAIGGFVAPLLLCFGFMIYWGYGVAPALFVGIAAGVTSLATKSRIIAELGLFNTRIAHVMMAGALIADTLSLILFALLLSSAGSGTFEASTLIPVLLKATTFFVFIWIVARVLLPALRKSVNIEELLCGKGRFFAAVSFALILGEAAHFAGLHSILGAFVGGILINEDILGKASRGELKKQVGQLSLGFLAPFFFVTAGFGVDLSVLSSHTALVLAVIALGTLGKIAGTASFYAVTGKGWREGVAIGTGMNGRGAVEIVVAQIGLELGVIDSTVFSLLVFMALATTATVPVLLTWSVSWLRKRDQLVVFNEEAEEKLVSS